MMKSFHKSRLISSYLLYSISSAVFSQKYDINTIHNPPKIIEKCNFELTTGTSRHFKIDKKYNNEYDCTIKLNSIGFDPYGEARVSIIPSKYIDTNIKSSGFIKTKSEQWTFHGYPFFTIAPVEYKNLAFTLIEKDSSTTLVGRESQSGYIAQGGPYTTEGISIFRITTSFGVSAHLAFEPATPATTRNAVENDLIKIVESVHATQASPASASSH